MQISCPGCSFRADVSDELFGKTATCPKCQTRFVVEAGLELGLEGGARAMACPRCPGALLEGSQAPAGSRACASCGGSYLPAPALGALLETAGIAIESLEDLLPAAREKRLRCPQCSGPLLGLELGGHALDACPSCRGAFLRESSLFSLSDGRWGAARPETSCCLHATSRAEYRCEDCRELLCRHCVEAGFQVFFCQVCGGHASSMNPTAEAPPAVASPEERYATRGNADLETRTPVEVALYPFKGLGVYLLVGYVVVMAVGTLFWPIRFVVALLVPAFLFKIVRSTVGGNDELPDWPDFDVWALMRDTITLWIISLCAGAPALLVIGTMLLGASGVAFVIGLPILLLATLLGFLFWIPAFGSVAVYENGWLIPRIDRHVIALRAGGKDTLLFAGLLAGLFVLRILLQMTLELIPWIGWLLSTSLELYAGVMASHLVGILFRRYVEEMDEAYLR